MRTLFLFIFYSFTITAFAQKFTLIKDSLNPIVSDSTIRGTYFGTGWTDIDNDSNLDLFYAGTIYKNLGNGNFKIADGSTTIPTATSLNSCSWADYENDGDLDLIYSRFTAPSTLQTRIYANDGNGQFTETNTILNTINSATWSVQWCDYNNDNYVDFILTFADLFLGTNRFPNRLYRGNSDGTFTEVTEPYDFLTEKAAYTVSNWTDYDEDGDTDLFIASGPAAGPTGIKRDFLFKNLQVETGNEGFVKLTNTDLSFAEDPQDGQCYNAIDYDNDGDLDICLTNYSGVENKFYINNSGAYQSTNAPFTAGNNQNLANAWGDFDNDGDLDVIITASSTTGSGYFVNNGDGTFTENNTNLINTATSGNSTGATIGDYDNDGDLDFFVVGQGVKGLFRNDLAIKNHFVNIKLIGNPSNKAALGTRLELMTKIKGKLVTLKREVSASNTFMGHNSLRVHFGLGKAPKIDKLTIYWPSGNVDTYTKLRVNKFYTIEEGKKKPIDPPIKKRNNNNPKVIVYPNPSKNLVKVKIDNVETNTPITVKIMDASGLKISETNFNINQEIILNTASLSPGNYFMNIILGKKTVMKKLVIK